MTLRHLFGYPNEPSKEMMFTIKRYDTEQFGINYVIERDLLDEFNRTYHRKYVVNQLCKEFSTVEEHGKVKVDEQIIKEYYPETWLDHFIIRWIPNELRFGWLKPKHIRLDRCIQNVYRIDKLITKHYHRALVDPNLGRSISHVEPTYDYGTPYHRMAVYGYNPKELSTNIKTVVSLMRNQNGKLPSKLILTPDDYYRLLCTPGEFWYADSSDKHMEYHSVPVSVDNSINVSYLVA